MTPMIRMLFSAAALISAPVWTNAIAAEPGADYVLLKVGSEDIRSSEVEEIWKSLVPAPDAPAFNKVDAKIRDNVLRGIIAERMLYNEATKQAIDKSAEVAQQLEVLRKKLVVKQLLQSKTQDVVKDEDIKREYDRMVAKNKDEQEVRARHILVATEKEAAAIKARLNKGEAFEKLAGETSKDPGSAKEGGDLGYFTKDKMVKSFADAAFKLSKGQVSDPVKSDFGWHIIKLEDKRNVAPPAFADVKEQIKTGLQEKALNTYVEQIIGKSDVKLFDASGKELPFEKSPKPAKDDAAKQ